MKTLNKFLNELAPIGKLKKPDTIATDSTIKEIVDFGIAKYGKNSDLNYIDTSEVTNMEYLFKDTDFNGDIRYWDVSNVVNMNYMFNGCERFNQDLSRWDVYNVKEMVGMF